MIRLIKNTTAICVLCWITLLGGYAQKKAPDADSLFLKARDAAFAEHLNEARRLCRELLSYFPDYYDASVLLGRTYAWELKTDSARMVLNPLLDIEPDSYDVLSLLADNEIWGGQYNKALEVIDYSMEFYPSDEDFLYRKANAYYLKKDNVGAIKVLHTLLTLSPDHAKGNELLNVILPPERFIDELYATANEEARAGNWKLARRYCRQVLAEDSTHFDAALLMAQLFAFEHRFDSTRNINVQLYSINPRHYDLLELMVNVEIWNRKYNIALEQVEKALTTYPADEKFLFQKARIQYLSKDYKEALKTIDELLIINPNHEEATVLKKNILENHRYKDYVFVENFFEFFKDPYLSRRMITSTGISKWTRHGTYIAKVNTGGELPWQSPVYQYALGTYRQYELEAYQQLFPTNYLYLDYAYSQNSFFPTHRGAVEFFQRLPEGFEASIGVRCLYWEVPHWIYTGSLSWLYGRNYLAGRLFFYHNNSRWINSYHLTYRRYFSEKEDYIYTTVGFGNYSDDFVQLDAVLGNSWLAQIGLLKFITVRWFLTASVGYAYDDGYRSRFQSLAGVRYYFNMFP